MSGLVLLIVLGAAGVGLLIHAALIHLAAIVVMEEPRFTSAAMAVMIMWAVAVPLELLRVWRPAGVVVWLLAGFGSLKISYGASHGRTLALFVASAVVAGLVGLGLGFIKAQLAPA